MRQIRTICLITGALMGNAAAEKKLAIKDLLPAVQKTVLRESEGAEIKNIGKETEDGVVQYEVETVRNGKRRDFNVDTKGVLLVVEEETLLDSIPAAAKAAILKKVADGKIGMVELVQKGRATMYEAGYTGKNGKKHEILVKADGTETKS